MPWLSAYKVWLIEVAKYEKVSEEISSNLSQSDKNINNNVINGVASLLYAMYDMIVLLRWISKYQKHMDRWKSVLL